MTSKLARLALAALTVMLTACTTAGAATQPADVTRLQTIAAVVPPTPAPTPSPTAIAATAPPAVTLDPCTLYTQSNASNLIGVTLGPGKQQIVGSLNVCTYAKGVTEVKIFVAPPTDPAAAKDYYESNKAQVPAGTLLTELPDFYDGSVIARSSLPGVAISAIFVLDGSNFFELYCGFPACNDEGLQGGAQLIAGRLP
jgi:hypothetical protein